ncbi:c-type cytochrome [Oceanomicrobium pacificus]|uniref:Cytochrome c n=1 Tax=Oceanomicrobium pacificus TaxID=2692916 RepID=A0A6B0U1D4_9RHOB|nr:cytochrome c [Oceanomicrobium pacificus]MXU64911.1 cytochrome c [Oceanomicrobium pacificus]
MKRPIRAILATAALAGLAIGAPVAADAISDRQAAMKTVGKNVGPLFGMMKGEVDFDADLAKSSAEAIAEQAAKVPMLFEEQALDGKTEAKPEIWANWDDFVSKAGDMEKAAMAVAAAATDLDGLKASLGQLGGTCQACHQEYRVKK